MKKSHLSKLQKFILLVLILAIYTVIMINKYGLEKGPLVSLTTWSFFVFCTPIADAGFLIDFPVRLLTGLKMFHSEIIVWIIATIITSTAIIYNPNIFSSTGLLNIFYHILTHIYPYGIIILLSAIGTFLSIHFGDEVYDNISSKKKKKKENKLYIKYFLLSCLIVTITISYYYIIKSFNLSISIF